MDSAAYRIFVASIEELSEEQVADMAEKLRLKKDGGTLDRVTGGLMAERSGCPYCSSPETVKTRQSARRATVQVQLVREDLQPFHRHSLQSTSRQDQADNVGGLYGRRPVPGKDR